MTRPRARLVSTICAVLLLVTPPAYPDPTDDSSAPSTSSTPWWMGNVPGVARLAPDRERPSGAIGLHGCTIRNPLFQDDPRRVRPFVPEEYDLGTNAYFGPGVATVVVAVLTCDGAGLAPGESTPIVLSLIAVQVVARPGEAGGVDAAWRLYDRSTVNVLPSSSWYLLAAHTDSARLADRFEKARVPVLLAEDTKDHRDYGDAGPLASQRDELTVPGYRVTTSTLHADPFVHNHDWFFWHGSGDERAGFLLHLHAMEDTSCGYHLSPVQQVARPWCGTTVTAAPDSPVATFLGGTSRSTPFAFNHPASSSPGYLELAEQPDEQQAAR